MRTAIRPIRVLVVLAFSLVVGLYALSPRPTTHAATTDITHCTDWPIAKMRDAAGDKDDLISTYQALVPVKLSSNLLPLNVVPSAGGT